jgi:hypothetical protein
MPRRLLCCLGALFAVALALNAPGQESTPTDLRFEVSVAAGLLARPTNGRLLIVLGRTKDRDPFSRTAALEFRDNGNSIRANSISPAESGRRSGKRCPSFRN